MGHPFPVNAFMPPIFFGPTRFKIFGKNFKAGGAKEDRGHKRIPLAHPNGLPFHGENNPTRKLFMGGYLLQNPFRPSQLGHGALGLCLPFFHAFGKAGKLDKAKVFLGFRHNIYLDFYDAIPMGTL